MPKRKLTNREARSGYTNYFGFNPDWQKQKAVCGYEHCIELMPLKRNSKKSCPIFGHDCPGGKEMAQKCKIQMDDILKGNRGE